MKDLGMDQKRMMARIVDFLQKGVWEVRLEDMTKVKSFGMGFIRIFLMAAGNFRKNDCPRNATVLTYYSVLNVVPLLAVVFAVAKGFGLEKLVVRQIFRLAKDANWQAEVTGKVIDLSRSLFAQAKGEVIVGVALVVILWTVYSILDKMEDSFNTIWEVGQPRPIIRRLINYMSVLILGPVLLALWSSVNVLIVSEVRGVMNDITLLGPTSIAIFILMKMLPFISIWLLLMILYVIMPNTKVSVKASIFAAILAGSLIQVFQWVYITFQIGVSTKSAIYGSFAAIPLFLAWLQVSWMIVLFGAQVASACEHYETYGLHPDYSRIGVAGRRLFMLKIFHLLVKRFEAGQRPLTVYGIGSTLKIPARLVQQILSDLAGVGLVVEVARGDKRGLSYQPARAVEGMTIKMILDAYEKQGDNEAAREDDEDNIALTLRSLFDAMEGSPANVKLGEI